MRSAKRKQSGFTLIELLVVIIIVAILAAVGIPLLQGNIERAIASEATAGLGAIRTGLRAFFAENQDYTGATFPAIGISTTLGANNNGDLDGRYFDDTDYTLVALGATTYCAGLNGNSGADLAVEPNATAAGIERSINQDGDIFDQDDCTGNVLN